MSAERAPLAVTSRSCTKCQRELPLTEEHYRPAPLGGFRRKCRRCCSAEGAALEMEARAALRETKARRAGKWQPRIVGEGGPEGGFTEYPIEGFRFVNLPDAHGMYADWNAVEAALAFVRYYRPELVCLLGDNVDFEGLSRFEKPAESVYSIGTDIDACQKLMRLVRESAPSARIIYLRGNHEARLERYLWKHPEAAQLMKLNGADVPRLVGLADHNIEWFESGHFQANESLMFKHGNAVRSRSAYSAMAELEKNGISGASGHTHRLGMHYKTDRRGARVWAESGCLCQLDPQYAEGQTMDWQQGLSFGSASLTGGSFTLHTAPIVNGRVKAMGVDIGA